MLTKNIGRTNVFIITKKIFSSGNIRLSVYEKDDTKKITRKNKITKGRKSYISRDNPDDKKNEIINNTAISRYDNTAESKICPNIIELLLTGEIWIR